MRLNLKGCNECAYKSRCVEYMKDGSCLFAPQIAQLWYYDCLIKSNEVVKTVFVDFARRYKAQK